MKKPLLEVIVCSVADAIAAQNGGAGRLEIVRDLECGGLTPKLDLVRQIRDVVDLPLRVMLRESVGYDVRDDDEVDTLSVAARDFEALGIDGLVLGFLKDSRVDVELTARVLACAPTVKATFHHAFEDTSDKVNALSSIKAFSQVDRILSSGGSGDLNSRIRRLSEYESRATSKIEIIAGGGINSTNISLIKRCTGIREFHVGRAARDHLHVNGPVSADLVEELVRLLNDL